MKLLEDRPKCIKEFKKDDVIEKYRKLYAAGEIPAAIYVAVCKAISKTKV